MYFQKEIETMPRKELRALQLERLKWTVDYCINNVPFYAERLGRAGITGDKIKSLRTFATSLLRPKTICATITRLVCLPNR
jgi:phenylacetate-coenzyme A ligase PaaK-like adenylate-forming protein